MVAAAGEIIASDYRCANSKLAYPCRWLSTLCEKSCPLYTFLQLKKNVCCYIHICCPYNGVFAYRFASALCEMARRRFRGKSDMLMIHKYRYVELSAAIFGKNKKLWNRMSFIPQLLFSNILLKYKLSLLYIQRFCFFSILNGMTDEEEHVWYIIYLYKKKIKRWPWEETTVEY